LLGRYEEALQDLEQALRLDPNNSELRLLLERTRAKLAEKRAAALPTPPSVAPAKDGPAAAPPAAAPQAQAAPAPAAAAAPAPPASSPAPTAPPAAPPKDAARRAEACHAEGRRLIQQERFEEAIVQLTCAVTLNPKAALAWNARGYARMRLGRYREAIADFDRALALQPSYENARQNREAALRRIQPR
jgi:tetratricopeptide (TPR) repeat protein